MNSSVQLDGSRRCEGRSRRPPSAIHGSVSFGVLQVSFRVIQNASIVQQFVFEFEFEFVFKPLHSNFGVEMSRFEFEFEFESRRRHVEARRGS